MSGRDRNQPCWCGSGKKLKKCHLAREDQQVPSMWDMEKQLRSIFKTKACLHPDASPATCQGGIIRAHTVRRSADLKAIERNGHVYSGYVDMATLNRTGGKPVVKLIGINDASTFWGFCAKHDAAAFAPLETQTLVPTDEQAFLLAYRPLVKELYLKKAQLDTMPLTRDTDKGKPKGAQLAIQNLVAGLTIGIKAAVADLNHYKLLYDAELKAKNYSRVRYVVVYLDSQPDIMCSGVLQPRYTFDGRKIQEFAMLDAPLHMIGFSLVSTGTAGAAVFSWRDDSDASCSVLVDSLLSLKEEQIPHALVRYVFSELENTFIKPDWWEALEPSSRKALEARVSHNVGPMNQVAPDYLANDGVQAVGWKVTRIEQKR